MYLLTKEWFVVAMPFVICRKEGTVATKSSSSIALCVRYQ